MYTTVTSRAITAISETSTIYCCSGGRFARHTEEERLRRQIEAFGVAFREVKTMIEAQQKVVNRSPGKLMMTLSFDSSVAQFRRMTTLMEEESGRGSLHIDTASSVGAVAAQ